MQRIVERGRRQRQVDQIRTTEVEKEDFERFSVAIETAVSDPQVLHWVAVQFWVEREGRHLKLHNRNGHDSRSMGLV